MELKKGQFQYIDSYNESHDVPFYFNEYNSVMDLLSDRCIEEWGDCKGRAWCATCHVSIETTIPIAPDEEQRLSQLSDRSTHSRLACQIPLDHSLLGKHVYYIGDD